MRLIVDVFPGSDEDLGDLGDGYFKSLIELILIEWRVSMMKSEPNVIVQEEEVFRPLQNMFVKN